MKCPECETENPVDSKFCKECATPLPTSEEPKVSVTKTLETPQEELTRGTTLAGRYEILEELGRGGMGNVYRVVDKKINEEVALKLLKPEIAADKKTLERFSNELKLARKIVHKNVGRMYHLGEERGTHFITMEYVPGQDLKGLIRQSGQLAVGTTLNIAKQICEGLAEAHRLGVVHRDLKPSNIMIDKDGSARIMDFGIARTIKGKGITGEGVIIGTPEYMSTEQVEGKDLDQRSDLYSLGIILYEMVTGRTPFEGDTPLNIAVKHKTESPPDPKDLNSQIPDDLSRLIHKCLEKDREKRYQSAGEVRSELENIERGIPVTEQAVPKKKPLTSKEITVTFGLKKLFIPALIAIAVVITGIILWHPWSVEKTIPVPSDKPSLAVLYFENVSGDENLEGWRTGLSELLITDLMQSMLINVLPQEKIFSILQNLNLLEAQKYSTEDLLKVADAGKVTHTVTGSLMKVGENIIITWRIQNPRTNEIIKSDKIECKGEQEIVLRADDLTKEIKLALNLTGEQIASDIDDAIGEITTGSPVAYKFFSEGTKLYYWGEHRKAIEPLKKAVAVDPNFAMAYRNLAAIYHNRGDETEANKNRQKAFELSDRLPEKERYLIQGDYYINNEENYDKAEEALTKLLELYPKDLLGNRMLAVVFWTYGENENAIERIRMNTQNFPENAQEHWNLVESLMYIGSLIEAEEVIEGYLKNYPDNVIVRPPLISIYIHQGRYDLALAELDKLFHLDPTRYGFYPEIRGDIYHLRSDYGKAEQEYGELLDSQNPRKQGMGIFRLAHLNFTQGRFAKSIELLKRVIELGKKMEVKDYESELRRELAYFYLKSGNSAEALKECDKAWEIAAETGDQGSQELALFYKAWAYLGIKSTTEAQRTANELRQMLENKRDKRAVNRYYLLEGMIALEIKDYDKAIESCKQALSLAPHYRHFMRKNERCIYIEPLAFAYYSRGDLDKAREEYERIISLTLNRTFNGDIYVKSFYMLGKICEKQNDKSKAIEHYEKFLDLWKDADPGIVEVEEAKKRLKRLRDQ